jgi:hypothetical protein
LPRRERVAHNQPASVSAMQQAHALRCAPALRCAARSSRAAAAAAALPPPPRRARATRRAAVVLAAGQARTHARTRTHAPPHAQRTHAARRG